MVDAVSGVVSRARYFPFGQVRGVVNQMPTDRGFVGQVEDDSTGLDYLGARFLDPGSGMFLTVDPLVGVTGDPYLYAGGNPATLSDPNGLEALPGGGWLFEGGGVQAQLARDRDYQARVNLWNDINHRDRPDKKAMFSNDRGSSVWLLAIAAVVLIGIGIGCVASGVALCATAAAAIGTPALEIANDVANGAPTGTGESAQLLTLLRARPVIGPATNTAPFGELANPATVNNASSPIRSFVTEADTTYLRVYSGDKTAGGFLMGSAPSSADSAVSGLALPPGNNADFIQEVLVPSGTRLQSSIAAPAFGQPGGLLQFELLDQIPVKNFGPGLPFR